MKTIIGSEEWCAFPELALPAVKARIDSGAKTSSIHAFNIQTFRRNQKLWASFEVHPLQNDRKTVIRCERPVVDKRSVKSSSGLAETRYVVSTEIKMGEESWSIELTLANRDSMGYRMLLGREAMSGRLMVDPEQSFCLGSRSNKSLLKLYSGNETKSSGLKIALLGSDSELYSHQRLLEAGEERGHEMLFLDIRQCYFKLDVENPELHSRGGTFLSDLNAVITRIKPSLTDYGCALARQFECMKVLTANSADAVSKSRDKLLFLELMLKHGLSIPISGFAHSALDTTDLIDMVGGAPLIVKLLGGSQGRGVMLAETKKQAETLVNAFKTQQVELVVQEFIKEADGKDLRCFVIDGKLIASIQRTAAVGEFRANQRFGGSSKVIKLTPQERKLAIGVTKVLGLNVAEVVLIRSNRGPLVLDVNATPALEAIENATGKDIAGMMIASLEKKLGWKRELGTVS